MKLFHGTFLAITAAAAIAAPAVFPSTAAAQQAAAAPGVSAVRHGHGGIFRVLRSLNLTQDQKTQMRGILQQYRAQHPKGSAPDPQARKAMRRQVIDLLTPAQKAQLRTDMRERRARRSPQPFPTEQPTPQP